MDNKWFVCIIYEIETTKYKDNGLYQAIDLGIDNLVFGVNLHFKFLQIKNRRADRYWKKVLEEVQSKRDHCKKSSHRWHRYNSKYIKAK